MATGKNQPVTGTVVLAPIHNKIPVFTRAGKYVGYVRHDGTAWRAVHYMGGPLTVDFATMPLATKALRKEDAERQVRIAQAKS